MPIIDGICVEQTTANERDIFIVSFPLVMTKAADQVSKDILSEFGCPVILVPDCWVPGPEEYVMRGEEDDIGVGSFGGTA